jgi:ribonuclease HII
LPWQFKVRQISFDKFRQFCRGRLWTPLSEPFKYKVYHLLTHLVSSCPCNISRGPLAGPVVAGAVVLPCHWLEQGLCASFRGLNDSKQLSEQEREKFYAAITSHPEVRFAIAIVDVEMIDRINIRQAAWRAMNLALDQLEPRAEHVLVDGLRIKWLPYPQTALVQGDARSYSIAAASVLAKVTRDRLMLEYHRQFPGYGFADHKGYGTPQHLAAIQKLGSCPIHRRSFAPFRPVAKPMELFPEPS